MDITTRMKKYMTTKPVKLLSMIIVLIGVVNWIVNRITKKNYIKILFPEYYIYVYDIIEIALIFLIIRKIMLLQSN